jgi:hypothetical protein
MFFTESFSQKMTRDYRIQKLHAFNQLPSASPISETVLLLSFFLLKMICVPEVSDQGMCGGMAAVHKFLSANLTMRMVFRKVIQLSTLGSKMKYIVWKITDTPQRIGGAPCMIHWRFEQLIFTYIGCVAFTSVPIPVFPIQVLTGRRRQCIR